MFITKITTKYSVQYFLKTKIVSRSAYKNYDSESYYGKYFSTSGHLSKGVSWDVQL